ncbi:TlyA family RNA methyltransferase [Rubellicoccus peritrichatus]|uniref:TlyA family RNA methyltransferase n=1 Tax=Rubellicoccus peritrichatus TaxID=3080537 RepID=A0AAQ3LDL8_9BACT|nr:TlyA family RNA methyltransferase [Puniceicoccus sp. CR14]WOO43541.1 TlyA family RNA methyltransferase [Puniceicoccus sp. CR14]
MASPQDSLRADELLVRQGLASTKSMARRLILDKRIALAGDLITRPGQKLSPDDKMSISGPKPFVSRAGEKLEGFLKKYPVNVEDLECIDIGASTGGFTDCMLRRGAKSVVCVDVGHGQLNPSITENSRVTNLEGVNARNLDDVDLPLPDYDLAVMDLSFISLKLVLRPAWNRVRSGGTLICLVKPQFEAGKEASDTAGGVIRDSALQRQIVKDIKQFTSSHLSGSILIGECESPIKGGDGNREFLLGWRRNQVS